MWRGRTNRYANKRKHKRKLKQRHAMLYDGNRTNLDMVRQRYQSDDSEWSRKHHPRNGGYEYWSQFCRSGTRRFAKDETNGVIRARYRDILKLLNDDNMDDIQALQGSDYEKMFDFWWTLW